MAARNEIIDFCDQTLAVTSFTDYGPNGLQVPGKLEVELVATSVSAHLGTIEAAVELGADLLICHHGLFWEFHPRALSEPMAKRLKAALNADLNLAGYHLPLDAHPEIGNNALLRSGLGLEPDPTEFGLAKGAAIGAVGVAPGGISQAELIKRVTALTDREPLIQGDGPDLISRIGLLSGAGASAIHEASQLGLDALITGEPAEHAMADATEAGIHFIAAGHYATETFGIRRLGDLVAEQFGVEHSFIDSPNPV